MLNVERARLARLLARQYLYQVRRPNGPTIIPRRYRTEFASISLAAVNNQEGMGQR